jgi:hypothetical protein
VRPADTVLASVVLLMTVSSVWPSSARKYFTCSVETRFQAKSFAGSMPSGSALLPSGGGASGSAWKYRTV